MKVLAYRTAVPVLAAAVLAGGTTAAVPAAAQSTVNLHTLICYETEDWGADGDELYLIVNRTKVWSSADSVDCDHDTPRRVAVNRKAKTGDTVYLYDADSPDGDDFLGSDIIEGSRGTLVFNEDDALYNLDYGPA
ncbi:hypothetical protein [Nocardiopsis algeriensis]|uniref:Uncharacterized protein n=1 Tax=Nocardiopsis algeriensis TaxID=1478215 RepID=A0A841IHH1_9ACTN|nr:hypothetical protein [Nocardiopsis algeriensis]MBB6118083.1 hypothetical protein [Nocardiopsis algeriensis]